jgi:hypothetical protein
MRNLLLLFTFYLVLSSCEDKPVKASGFGDLTLGAEFESLALYKDFEKVLENEYHNPYYKISDEIGYVANVYITTNNGNINEVKFESTKDTDTAELERMYGKLIEQKLDTLRHFKNLTLPNMKFYISADTTTLYSIVYQQEGRRKGTYYNEYRYTSTDAAIKQVAETRKQLGLK